MKARLKRLPETIRACDGELLHLPNRSLWLAAPECQVLSAKEGHETERLRRDLEMARKRKDGGFFLNALSARCNFGDFLRVG